MANLKLYRKQDSILPDYVSISCDNKIYHRIGLKFFKPSIGGYPIVSGRKYPFRYLDFNCYTSYGSILLFSNLLINNFFSDIRNFSLFIAHKCKRRNGKPICKEDSLNKEIVQMYMAMIDTYNKEYNNNNNTYNH